MRMFLLSSFVAVGLVTIGAQAQNAPAAPAKPPQGTTQTQPKPAPPTTTTPAPAPAAPATQTPAAPRRAPAPAPSTRGGMSITATDPKGATLPGISVSISGTSSRNGETDASGHLSVVGLMAGTYRLRFDGEKVVSFEREVTLRAGQVLDVDVSLNPAPEPPPPPAPAPAPAPAPVPAARNVGPKGQPQTVAILDWLDKEFVGREPRRESIIACSGNERTTIVQLNEAMPQRLYEDADIVYYVLGGEGNVTLDGRNSRIATNAFISVPRGTAHTFEKRGNRPLMLLAVLGGEPCERPK